MTSLNPLHTTMQNIYNQLSNQVQSTKPGWADADVAQRLGVPAGLVQDLRNDVKAAVDGHDPEKTAANLLKGLQKLQTFVGSQGLYGNADAKELPADLGPDRDGISLVMGKDGRPEQVKMAKELPADSGPDRDGISLVMGKNGQPEQVKMAKELPADSGPDRDGIALVMGKDGRPEQVKMAKELPADSGPDRDGISLVMGKNGRPEQVKMAKELPADSGPDRDGISLVMGKNGQPEQVKMAKELPADSGPDRDGISLVMGKNGQPEQVKMAKELPADSGPDRDGISLVMGKDGQPEQISSTEAQRLESQASGSVEAKSDKVVSYLKEFLEAGATGNNAEQALKGLRDAMQHLFDDIANNPVQVRKALMNSIRSQA